MSGNLDRMVIDRAAKWGASLVGFADVEHNEVEMVVELKNQGWKRAVVMAQQLSRGIVDTITDRPTALYAGHYALVNQKLDILALEVASFLQDLGWRALPVPASAVVSEETLSSYLSHRAVAAAAGLGWIGKNQLLITPEYGPRVRLVTVLTDAPLKAGSPIKERCGKCTRCIDACPVKAIKDTDLALRDREAHLNVHECNQHLWDWQGELGYRVCGVCMRVCPHGQ
ncbi:MAG: epoxyqueuosine reductase [Syntrophothermus sp.]|uniref:4Fe-4S double cluster binding domain-containing protein n=1 Tax=Syntrophothermus sp. TaxID=2736299 RepID=UPI00257E18ED|nr:4Fe-4S double cluster binding domain-containing protein [Syntrophothermus sp.]NSW83696.1 epoxyqueuosine reductase [Syntrophothermus sp.]